ncbi:MAG: hypothetical protein OXH57_13155 [Ekhidna sp.]|nr:hypothetical protein [Ekhidna sp.]
MPISRQTAQKKGQIEYSIRKDMPPVFYDKVQIITVDELLDGHLFNTPPTLKEVKLYRAKQTKLEL